jgi:hypothetical protein
MYEHDPAFMRAGRKMLQQWKDAFLNDVLPQTNYENKRYSHPFNWKWTLASIHVNGAHTRHL